jgi:hypothetical protein
MLTPSIATAIDPPPALFSHHQNLLQGPLMAPSTFVRAVVARFHAALTEIEATVTVEDPPVPHVPFYSVTL